jgi:hypothetical protein
VRKRLFLIAVVGLSLGALLGVSLPAHASISGTAFFQCTVKLPVWPTPNGPAVKCNGTATGFITGTKTTGGVYTGTAANDKFVGAAATYRETCIGPEPVNGFANGTFTVSNMTLTNPSSQKGQGSAKFNWTRVGVNAIITLSGGLVKKTPTGATVAKGSSGVAAALFIPTSTPGNCNPGGAKPLTALITGQSFFII